MASFGKQLPKCKYGSLCYRANPEHRMEYWHPENLSNTRTDAAEEPLSDTGPEEGEKIDGAPEGEKGLYPLEGLRNGEINESGRNDSLPIIATSAKNADAGVLVLLVGVPGSGKSTFCSKLMANAAQPWTRICQDIINRGKKGTRQECLKFAERALAQKHSVVIDRCNIDRDQRLEFLQLAARFGIESHGVVLDLPVSVCVQRASKRIGHEGGLNAGNAGSIISRFSSTRQLPALSEGFTRIAFCRTDYEVEQVVQQYRELLHSKGLQPGLFGAARSKSKNALPLVEGINQLHWVDKLGSKDGQVENVRDGLQQAEVVGGGKTEQMEGPSSPCRSEACSARDLAGSACIEDKGRSTLAFPSISTSDFQFDHGKASTLLVEAVAKFLMTEDSKMRLLLVDLTNSHMLSLVRTKAREKGLDSNRFLSFVGDITKLRSCHGPACNIIANAANWRLKAGGGGVNAAIYSAAGQDFERATKEVAQTLNPGTSVVVQLPESSPLHRNEGVTHVIHVLGPNMNPQRPNCLSGDYSEGCRLLESSYSSLFQKFSSIVRSSVVAGDRPKLEATCTVDDSSKQEASDKPFVATGSNHQKPSKNAFTVLMQAAKRNRELKDANPKRDKVRVTEVVVARAGEGTDNATRPSELDMSRFCGPGEVSLQNQPHSSAGGISINIFSTAVVRKEESDIEKPEGLTGAKGNQQGGTNNGKRWDSWALALYNKAMHPEQHTDALQITDEAVVLHDMYPKAKKHLLVVARRPGLDGLDNVRKEHLPLLRHMHWLGEEWAARSIKEDPSLSFRLGYHLLPSMRQLHLHVISQDFDSASLKNKKHWNSFTTPFFRDSLDVLDQLEGHERVELSDEAAETLLSLELRCHRCRSAHPNLPRLKQHISKCRDPFANSSFHITIESSAI